MTNRIVQNQICEGLIYLILHIIASLLNKVHIYASRYCIRLYKIHSGITFILFDQFCLVFNGG